MGGIKVEDFTQSRAYQEIFGLGEARGGVAEAANVTLRLLNRRCGPLTDAPQLMGEVVTECGPSESPDQ